MMKDNVGTVDQVTFTLNGKPVQTTVQTEVCNVCGTKVDQSPCPLPEDSDVVCPQTKTI